MDPAVEHIKRKKYFSLFVCMLSKHHFVGNNIFLFVNNPHSIAHKISSFILV